MHGNEFSVIKAAVDEYTKAKNLIEDIARRREQLKAHREQRELIKIGFIGLGFIGNTGTIEIPETMQAELAKWLDDRFAKVQSDAAYYQRQLTCPAGTSD